MVCQLTLGKVAEMHTGISWSRSEGWTKSWGIILPASCLLALWATDKKTYIDHKLRLPIPTEVIYWDDIRWWYLHLTNHRRNSCGTKTPEALGFAGLCVTAITMRYSAGDKNVMLTLSACCFEGASVWPLWSLIMPYKNAIARAFTVDKSALSQTWSSED